MTSVVIVGAARTAIGKFGGSLSGLPAPHLGAQAMHAAIERAGVEPSRVEEVFFGNVLQAGLGQNPARQAALEAGVPEDIPATSINIVCGSGLQSVILAANSIAAGYRGMAMAGGMENMSAAPYLLNRARWGLRMGNQPLVDSMINDGLWCSINSYHMGVTAENIARRWHISRQEQDDIAFLSQHRAIQAQASGAFRQEIVPITIRDKKTERIFDADEHIRLDITREELAQLKPVFDPAGTVTAGNSSGINDGAAALLLMNEADARSGGLHPLARIRSYAVCGVDPSIMGIGPIPAVRQALNRAGMSIDSLDLIEANEAFAAQFIAVGRELALPPEKTNIYGGAIALGHPIGASGARILVTLLHALITRDKTLGLATLCVGGGHGVAVIIERL